MKKYMKFVLEFLLTAALAISMVACGGALGDSGESGGNSGGNKTEEVKAEVEISLNKTSLKLFKNEKTDLVAYVYGTNDEIVWTSSDGNVASVSAGKVTALKGGETTIRAAVGGKYSECSVTVEEASAFYPELYLSTSETYLSVGGEMEIEAFVKVGSEEVFSVIAWQSADEAVATVKDGAVKGVSVGKTSVKATAEINGEIVVKTVEVTVRDGVYFTLDKDLELYLNQYNQGEKTEDSLTYEFIKDGTPVEASVNWSSSDPLVAAVSKTGDVSAIGAGTAVVKATCEYEGKLYVASSTVTVRKSEVDLGSLGDVDLSDGSLEIRLSGIDLDGSSKLERATVGGVELSSSYAGGKVGIDLQNCPYGEQVLTLEFSDAFVKYDLLAITKILRTKEDIINLIDVAGGFDAEYRYYGYFVLGNNIDLGYTETNAPSDDEPDTRITNAGFVGTFDGRGYVIYNALVEATGTATYLREGKIETGVKGGGIFGTISSKGIVKNLAVVNARLAQVSSKGAGVLCKKLFGTVDNVYVSCSRSGPAAYDAAIAFSISSTTRVSNTVVEMKYSNARTDQAGHAVIVSAAYDSGSVFNNVYGISDFEVMGNSSAAPTAIGSHSDYVGTEGNGVKTYKYTDEMTFDGLTSSVWNTQGIIPVFAKDNTTFADYKIEHYYKKDGRYVLYKTENKTRGAVGGVAYASTINIAGYGCFVGESGTVDKTTIKADGSSVLKLYYRPIIGIPLTNKDGSDTNSTLSVYGSTYASIEYQGDFNGKTDVYRVDYADIDDTWYSRLEFVGITAEEFLKTGCDMLDFNLYVDGKNPVYLNVYNGVNEDGTGATSKSVWITNSISAQNAGKYITILDPTGKSVDKITFGAWYRIRCYVGDLSGAFPTRMVNLSSQKANKLYVSGLTLNNADDQYGYTLEYYFKDGDGEYVKNADLTEEGSAFYGAQISPKAIDGYLFGSFAKDKGDGENLTIDEDGLTISLYYDRVYRVSSNVGAYLIPYGNRDIKTDKPDDDGFYKITVGEYSANHWAGKFLYTAGVNDLTNKYSSVTFKIRFTEYALTNEGHWVIYSGSNGKAFAYSNIESDVKKGQREGNLVFYDEDGNAVTKLIADETYTVWVNLLNASDSYTVSIGASGVNVVYYMTDLTFAEKVNYSVEIYKKSYISDEYQKDDELSFAGVAEKGESVTVKAEEIAHYTLNEELSELSFTAVEGYVAKLYYDEEATYVYTVNYVLFIGDGTRTVLTTESGRGYEGEKVVAEIKYFAKYYYIDASVVEITVSAEGENVINVYYETEEARKVKDLTGEDIFD